MSEIKNLLKAQQELKAAQERIPQNIREAAERLSEKAGIDYYGALEVLDMAIPDVQAPKRQVKTAKKANRKGNRGNDSAKARRRKNGFGGRVNPSGIREIKQRIKKTDGNKRECYKVALELFRRKGEWVTRKELQGLGIDTRVLSNRRKVNPCLPVGYIMQSSAHGYKAYNVKEALA